jgi:hypothetical protein
VFWRRKLPTGDDLVAEANRLGVSLHEIYKGGVDGNTILDEPELQRRILAAWAERRSAILSFAQTVGIIGTLALTLSLAIWNRHQQSKQESGDFMLRFDQLLASDESGRVTHELDVPGNLDHIGLAGDALDDAIEDFLDKYELLAAAYRNGLIDKDMADDAFSYDLEKALVDPKVRRFLQISIAQEADFYEGVFELAHAWEIKVPALAPMPQQSPPAAHIGSPSSAKPAATIAR